MVGAHNSLSSLLLTEVPDLVLVRCVCHSLHLCAERACKELPRQLEFLIRECHNYFSLRPKRLQDYQKFCEVYRAKVPRKIPKLAGTRWLAREAAVEVVLEQWDELRCFFRKAVTDDKCYSAEQILSIMDIPAYKAFLVFLKLTLTPICKTNKLFQSDSIDTFILFEDLMLLFKSFLKKIVVPAQLEKIPDSQLVTFPFAQHLMHVQATYLGYDFEVLAKQLKESEQEDVRKRCMNFLALFCSQLQERLPKNLQILKNINLFRPESATSQGKTSISDLLTQFKRFNVAECEQEWSSLSDKKWDDISTAEKFWANVYFDVDSAKIPRFRNIASFALSLLSLPISNAFVERAFSVYNTVKNKLRNRLSLEVVQSILALRYYLKKQGITCVQFEPNDKMLSKFNSHMYDHIAQDVQVELNLALDSIDVDCFDV
ncbi:hypothetical protein GE061_001740 [Apolygus lucorum]|uniref:HAT C-terminal dimerisation domain-containing protein n=1 Tax=Apolygus lucorum TaxID=248454 RepID=A0A6A4JXN8_APOLU|nr:hypothetical protein GE061_001740 [Apolygus lucorum]